MSYFKVSFININYSNYYIFENLYLKKKSQQQSFILESFILSSYLCIMTKRRAYLLMKYDAYTCKWNQCIFVNEIPCVFVNKIPCVFVNEIRGSVSYGSFEVNMYISIHVHVHTDGQFVSIWGYELGCQNAMVTSYIFWGYVRNMNF